MHHIALARGHALVVEGRGAEAAWAVRVGGDADAIGEQLLAGALPLSTRDLQRMSETLREHARGGRLEDHVLGAPGLVGQPPTPVPRGREPLAGSAQLCLAFAKREWSVVVG